MTGARGGGRPLVLVRRQSQVIERRLPRASDLVDRRVAHAREDVRHRVHHAAGDTLQQLVTRNPMLHVAPFNDPPDLPEMLPTAADAFLTNHRLVQREIRSVDPISVVMTPSR